MKPSAAPCNHASVVCLNVHELIRKYRCTACNEVMMCCCDEAFGRRFLSHQLTEGSELKTRRRVPVTIGFQANVCRECRGLPAAPAPAAEGYGRTTKIKRFYWREIFFAETYRICEWDEANPTATDEERVIEHKAIRAQVLAEIAIQHKAAPKYDLSEPSQSQIIEAYGVETRAIAVEYVDNGKKGALIKDGETAISPEAHAIRVLESEGWSVMVLESVPFHCLFGVMMWMLIQDPADPNCLMAGFGDRNAFANNEPLSEIWTALPDDFGSQGYGERRENAIDHHFESLPNDREELLWTFDYWKQYSYKLRQYLWAHREDDVDRARRLIEILPPEAILLILRYLTESYWDRYLGWPDLLAWRNGEYRFIEVKSSKDKLSQDQKQWLADNHNRLKFPFLLIKLHRIP